MNAETKHSGPVDVLENLAAWCNEKNIGAAEYKARSHTYAAVAELIEAAREATEEKLHNGASSKAACDRLVAALANVGSAS